MEILTIIGNANSGKTTLLNEFIVYANGHDFQLIDTQNKDEASLDSRTTYIVNNKIVVITTAGDNIAEMQSNIYYAASHNADIWITASRKQKTTRRYERLVYKAILEFANADKPNRSITTITPMIHFRKDIGRKREKQQKDRLQELIDILENKLNS